MLGVRRCYRRRRDQRLASSMNGSRSPRDRRQRFRSRNSVRRSTARVASPLHMRRFIGSWRFPKCFSTPMAACASTVASTRSSATRRGTCCGPTRDRNAIARRRKRRRWHKVVFPRFRRLPLARQRPRQSLSAISRARAQLIRPGGRVGLILPSGSAPTTAARCCAVTCSIGRRSIHGSDSTTAAESFHPLQHAIRAALDGKRRTDRHAQVSMRIERPCGTRCRPRRALSQDHTVTP